MKVYMDVYMIYEYILYGRMTVRIYECKDGFMYKFV